MSQVFKPVSYTVLANVAVGTSSSTSGVWSPTGSKTCLRITTTEDCYFRIDQASTGTAAVTNPILSSNQDAYVKVDNKVLNISTIGPDNNSDAPQIKFETDGGIDRPHGLSVGQLIKIQGTSGGDHSTWNAMSPTVASVVNSTCITIATSGDIAQSTGGTVSLGFSISQKGIASGASGRLSVTEVATVG